MKIFCSGIGGIGLSAYAALQHSLGHTVLGSDRGESQVTKDLEELGVSVSTNQDGSRVSKDADLFAYSEAIPEDAPERQKASEYGIEQQSYFQALGALSKDYNVIAVCGTHGKSSTTSMAAKVLVDAGLDPTVVVGTRVPDLGGKNWRKGESNIFLLEACEYRKSFHYLSPNTVLMTNVDGDHFDAFKDLEEYQQAFADFLQLLPSNGHVITHMNDPECQRLVEDSGRSGIDADIISLPKLQVLGRHMQENAQLVLALAKYLDIDEEPVLKSLLEYKGCWRRLERKGEYKGIPVYDDYGHHPKEIRATLAALKEGEPGKRIVCVFQPHTHERTLSFYEEFTKAFSDADLVLMPNIYEARKDIETERVDLDTFVADVAKGSGVEVRNTTSLEETQKLLKEEILTEGDVLLIMGAGDITRVTEDIVQYKIL